MFPKSIRWRIQAWHGFLLICLVGALLIAFYHYERAERLREIDTQLQGTLAPLIPALGGHPPRRSSEDVRTERNRPDAENEGAPDDPGRDFRGKGRSDFDRFPEAVRTGKFYYISWAPNGEIRAKSTNGPTMIPDLSEADKKKLIRSHGEFREAIHLAPDGGHLVLGTSLADLNSYLHRLALILFMSGTGIVAVGIAVGGWAAGRALRPISNISSTAEKIAAGDLSNRISIAENESELGKLTMVLNGTFERLEKLFEQQVRFTADASHELRTPIAVMLTQIQLALSRERTPEEYRQTLETCERAAERMRTLVNQLLELARTDAGEPTLVMESADLGKIARESIEFMEPLAQKKNIKLTHALDSIKIKADSMKLGQVLINLLNNAIVHNKEGTEVCVSVLRFGDMAVVRVADNGAGIPKEAQLHIFDRFYRVDKARSRNKGSGGLGLAICKVIVEAHQGTIRVQSDSGKGAEFIIELPVSLGGRGKTASATLFKFTHPKIEP